jgi:hypothetical protein
MSSNLFRKAALEKLSSPEEIDQLMQVTTPKGWIALFALVSLIAAAAAYGFYGSIPVRVSAAYCILNGDAQAVMYLSQADAAQVRPGNTAQISPATFGSDTSGFLVATVRQVSSSPVEQAQMQQTIGSEALARQLLQGGLLMEVTADLTPDGMGYRLSTGGSADTSSFNRTSCQADITVRQKAPIDLFLRSRG